MIDLGKNKSAKKELEDSSTVLAGNGLQNCFSRYSAQLVRGKPGKALETRPSASSSCLCRSLKLSLYQDKEG